MLKSVISSIVGSNIIPAAEGVSRIIDKFVETDDEKRAANIIKTKLMMKPGLTQMELNKIEASHRSVFVAGWRPFIGWVCGFSLLWHFVLFDIFSWIMINRSPGLLAPAQLTGTETLVTILISLLGLGAMRTAEKFAGRAR